MCAKLDHETGAGPRSSPWLAPGWERSRGAILGSNVGSLLFPCSNLTSLILVSATGISFGAYLGAAIVPQLLAAVGVGALLVHRTRSRVAPRAIRSAMAAPAAAPAASDSEPASQLTLIGGTVAIVGAVAAIVIGLAGGDVAPVFAIATAIVASCAIASGRAGTEPLELARSIPLGGVAIVAIAAIAAAPMGALATLVPDPDAILPPIVALPLIALVGGLLAASVKNLPAAAFGAFWLVGGSPAAVVAFLIGTNLLAIGTPHVRWRRSCASAWRPGRAFTSERGCTSARPWRYASAAGLLAVAALVLVR